MELSEVVRFAIEILKGLQQLHSIPILHLDLKPGNVLLDGNGHAYLSHTMSKSMGVFLANLG